MKAFTEHTGKCVPLYEQNIDTDQIVPKKFLLSVERTGFDKALFYDWRYHADGRPKADFVLNDPQYDGGSILLAGANFGCGSSREHAPWALAEYGFQVIIAPSFAEIFYSNCLKTGLLPVILNDTIVKDLVLRTRSRKGYLLTVDLERQKITDDTGLSIDFEIDQFRKTCLINGLDDIDLTLLANEKIAEYEKNRISFLNIR